MTVNLLCFVKLQIFVWTHIPYYLSIYSDCEIPEARPDADTVQPICGHFVFSLVFAQIICCLHFLNRVQSCDLDSVNIIQSIIQPFLLLST